LAVVTGNPTILIAIGVAVVGLLVLLILLFVLLGRRKRAAPIYPNATPDAAFSPPTSIQQEIPTALYQSQPPADAGKTQVFDRTSVMDSGANKTQLWQLPKAKLEFTGTTRKGDKVMIGLAGQEVQVGREADESAGNIKIPSVHVSRQHAVFKLEGDTMTITDLGSTSGTRVNGEKIAPRISTPVKVGDKIDFAEVSTIVVEP